MKMKKTKLLIPAIGMLVFTSAASVSGTVAWFTATRVFEMEAGNFAVVNTKDNLTATLTGGIGTIVNEGAIEVGATPVAEWANESARTTAVSGLGAGDKGKIYKQTDTGKYYVCTGAGTVSDPLDQPYALTDSSFDHNVATQNLVVPDAEGTKIGKFVNMTSATIASDGIVRDEANAKAGVILSAMTWDITFTVSFSASASKDIGLFLDATAANSYVKLKTDAAVTDTGAAFKIAFMPKTVPTNSYGLTKVWADNRPKTGDPHSQYISGGTAGSSTLASCTTDYTSATASMVNGTYTPNAASPSLIDSADTTAVPTTGSTTKANALLMSNYLGYFKCNAGNEVSLTFTCIAFFEGSDPSIESAADTVFETVKSKLTFGVDNLAD